MESVARQFAFQQHSMVLRNGWFSYRWTEILDMMAGTDTHTMLYPYPETSTSTNNETIATNSNNNNNNNTKTTHTVLSAQPIVENDEQPQYQPMPIEIVLEAIYKERPKIFFCPHVETSTGIILPDTYIQQIANAMHQINGLFVLDCIASGCIWIDMEHTGVDILITAPQKGWSGPPCAAFVCLSQNAYDTMMDQPMNSETSFSLSLKRWSTVMDTYVKKKSFAYHTTMPTDALRDFHQVTVETLNIGTSTLKDNQYQLGKEMRHLLTNKYELRSVAASGYDSPGVLVYYSPGMNCIDNPIMMSSFQQATVPPIQIAMGVPWKLQYEPKNCKTFRIGLFGIDKLMNIEHTIRTIDQGLYNVIQHFHTTNDSKNIIPLPRSMLSSSSSSNDETKTAA
jgi:alanine-glyoxylate transaminase / serine-glyoxylate transaminase / serine-pyruvate transaminase